MFKFIVLFTIIFLSFNSNIFSASIILTNGETVDGRIIEKTKEKLTINIRGVIKTFDINEIQKIKGRRIVARPLDTSSKVKASSTFFDGLEKASNGDFVQAKQIFKTIAPTESDNTNIKQSLNIIYDYENKIISKEYAILLFKGAYSYAIQDYDTAINSLTKALKIRPKSSEIFYNLSSIYQELNDYDNAIIYLKKLYAVSPTDPDVVFDLGCCYYLIEDFKHAITYLKKASNLITDDPYIYTLLGMSYYMLNKNSAAKNMLTKAQLFYNNSNNAQEAEKIKKFITTIL